MNGNIALSMEIGSAYALQVCLLQIPALVLFSAIYGASLSADQLTSHTFSMIFPQWDLVTVILCVFLLSYMYGEGKSNYFKVHSPFFLSFLHACIFLRKLTLLRVHQGTILILSYLTVMMGFYFSSFAKIAFEDSQMVNLGRGAKGTGFYLRSQ